MLRAQLLAKANSSKWNANTVKICSSEAVFVQSTAGHFFSRGLDKNIRRNTYTHPTAEYAKLLHSSFLPLLLSRHLSLHLSVCWCIVLSWHPLDISSYCSLTHTHTHLLLMNEWEKTLISIMCCFSFSVPLKQSLLFSPCSFSTHLLSHAHARLLVIKLIIKSFS